MTSVDVWSLNSVCLLYLVQEIGVFDIRRIAFGSSVLCLFLDLSVSLTLMRDRDSIFEKRVIS